MKKLIALLLTICMLMALCACGNVSGISDDDMNILEEAGFSQEQIEAMSEEQRQALLDELGIVMDYEAQKKEEEKKDPPKKYTADDVANGGKYKVTVADGGMMWNVFTLYYEDGKLVKIEVSFRKNDGEEPEEEVIEGDAIAEYSLFFIDYDGLTPGELINTLNDEGYTYTRIEPMN
jgi:major membrane immunogen (membrane-anchored lipoprotein)